MKVLIQLILTILLTVYTILQLTQYCPLTNHYIIQLHLDKVGHLTLIKHVLTHINHLLMLFMTLIANLKKLVGTLIKCLLIIVPSL